MFHHLEKPYEHLHDHYDGSTTGPQTYSGPHGKAIEEDVWKEEPVDFEPVPNPELLEQIRNNFEAQHISELSDLASSETEAPLTLALSDIELRGLAFRPLDMQGFPCHTTAFERGVQVLHL